MSNIVPALGINFAVYYDGEDLVGLAEAELPNLEAMSETIKGAGIAGEMKTIVLGHFSAMTLSLTWRNTTDAFVKLAHQKVHELYLYSSQQDYDAGVGEYRDRKVALFVKAIPSTLNIGKLATASLTDTKTDFEIPYLKLEIDDKERIEVDKLNYIFKVDGVDYLAGVRSALGKE
jgi:P2 family phage contractile tail tube protein